MITVSTLYVENLHQLLNLRKSIFNDILNYAYTLKKKKKCAILKDTNLKAIFVK